MESKKVDDILNKQVRKYIKRRKYKTNKITDVIERNDKEALILILNLKSRRIYDPFTFEPVLMSSYLNKMLLRIERGDES